MMKKANENNNLLRSISNLSNIEIIGTIVIALIILSATIPAAQNAPTEKPIIQAGQLTGQWEGLYYNYPLPIVMKMELHSTGGDEVQGELIFFPLDTKQRNIQGEKGKQEIKGTYDALTQTFELTPVKWIDNLNRLRTIKTLRGVLSMQRQEISGFRVSNEKQDYPAKTHFVMVRPARASDYLNVPMVEIFTGRKAEFERLREAQRLELERRRQAQLRERQRLRDKRRGITTQSDNTSAEQSSATENEKIQGETAPQPPNAEDMVTWASKIKDEYPDMDPRRISLSILLDRARNLFEDKHFQKCFGKTFDQMTFADREAIIGRFRKASHTRTPSYDYERELTPMEMLKEYSMFSKAFSDSGTNSASEILLSVFAHRVIRSWYDEIDTKISKWPADADAFNKLEKLEKAGVNRIITLWPSEKKRFGVTLTEARFRVAGPALIALAERTVEEASGYLVSVRK